MARSGSAETSRYHSSCLCGLSRAALRAVLCKARGSFAHLHKLESHVPPRQFLYGLLAGCGCDRRPLEQGKHRSDQRQHYPPQPDLQSQCARRAGLPVLDSQYPSPTLEVPWLSATMRKVPYGWDAYIDHLLNRFSLVQGLFIASP
ncbi:hypothetical protein PV05_06576 [Exophiala xenobiotica]|uniref:Uncharacterized protein n=1 Tax=Exophiala xenobiotica TaxID=348802 RepID=A0A0D2EFI3_9EURO|nr:uncharacterized protein PV05_06576 [Exophiala xenobiotica]KIW54203.1 hypothetical protein PV05_06576 [Exophiala xenobiotica]